MEPEYDFSSGERGKFYRRGAVFRFPIHIAPELVDRLNELARKKGIAPSDLANDILKRALEAEQS